MAIRAQLRELSRQRRRFDYRRLHLLLAREGHAMNHKKLRRLYTEEKLRRLPRVAALFDHLVETFEAYGSGHNVPPQTQ